MGTTKPDQIDALFAGLKQLSASAFPKHCPACGAVYESAEDFLRKTQSLEGRRAIKVIDDEEEGHFLELYRNCPCGSTLMDFFSDRRDLSPKGLARRKKFGELMARLEKLGIGTDEARTELLNLMHGKATPLLDRLGLRKKGG